MADTEAKTEADLEKALAQINDANTTAKEAIAIALTEIGKLLIEIRFPHEQQ